MYTRVVFPVHSLELRKRLCRHIFDDTIFFSARLMDHLRSGQPSSIHVVRCCNALPLNLCHSSWRVSSRRGALTATLPSGRRNDLSTEMCRATAPRRPKKRDHHWLLRFNGYAQLGGCRSPRPDVIICFPCIVDVLKDKATAYIVCRAISSLVAGPSTHARLAHRWCGETSGQSRLTARACHFDAHGMCSESDEPMEWAPGKESCIGRITITEEHGTLVACTSPRGRHS